jgi:hypothetical protein
MTHQTTPLIPETGSLQRSQADDRKAFIAVAERHLPTLYRFVAPAGHPIDSAAAVEQLLSRQVRQHPVPVHIYRSGRTHELMLDL